MPTSRKTGSVILPGEGGLTGAQFRCDGLSQPQRAPGVVADVDVRVIVGFGFRGRATAKAVHEPGRVVLTGPGGGEVFQVGQRADRAGPKRRAVADALAKRRGVDSHHTTVRAQFERRRSKRAGGSGAVNSADCISLD